MKPSIAEIETCLRNGRIPIIDGVALLEDTEDSVKSCTPDDMGNYVAFSHVWSDGLGSTTEKGLPKCQIKKLLDNTLESCKATCFWIDSLCVPQQQDLRKRAITLMAKTYRSAAAVVVLDARVQHYSIRDPLEEQLMALGLSVWQQRLWTLQEGSLAKRLLFKFSDALVDRETILEQGYAKRYTPVIRFAQILLDSVTKWVLGCTVSVGALQRNLYLRTSSRPDDEALAIAPFFNGDMPRLLETEGEDRTERLWLMVGRIPRSIIIHAGPNLSNRGFRWAPRSLLSQRATNIMDFVDGGCDITQQGLRGYFHLLLIDTPKRLRTDGPLFFDCPKLNSLVIFERLKKSENTTLNLYKGCVLAFVEAPKPATEWHLGAALTPLTSCEDELGRQYPLMEYKALVRIQVYSEELALREGLTLEEFREKACGVSCIPVETDIVIS